MGLNSQVLPRPLCGIVPPMITPLRDTNTLDVAGLERLIEHILAGGVCGGANLVPRLYVDLYDAARSKDLPTVESLHKKVMHICTTIYRVGRYKSSMLKGLKCALSCIGICNDFLAEPFHCFRCAERDVISQHLERLGIVQKD